MEKKEFKLNQNKLRVKKCCASCIFKEMEKCLTPSINDRRWCKKKRMTVFKDECCPDWMISQDMDMAGGGEPGRVKKADFIHWLGAEWPKLQAKGWNVDSVKMSWENENKTSVYM